MAGWLTSFGAIKKPPMVKLFISIIYFLGPPEDFEFPVFSILKFFS
jgi:hypothetical protein